MIRAPLTVQTLYAELDQQVRDAAAAAILHPQGSLVVKEIKGRRYWYHQQRIEGRQVQRYLGPETGELLRRIAERDAFKSLETERRTLVRSLHAAGFKGPDRRTGRVLQALADAGVFRLRAVLVGTAAFQIYGPMLGAVFPSAIAMTGDVDVAQFRSISIAVGDRTEAMQDVLGRFDPAFAPVLGLSHNPPSAYSAGSFKVEFLTPMRGPEEDDRAPLPAVGTWGQPLRFLDFLIYREVEATVLFEAGVAVRVPDPARYALHKLIVSQRRRDLAKARKDRAQAHQLLEVLAEDRPYDLKEHWAELCGRGMKWQSLARAGLEGISPSIRSLLP
jgi:hypothetical protein